MELKDLILQTLDEVTTDANMDSSAESDAESSAAAKGAGAKSALNAGNANNANQTASASQSANNANQSTQSTQNAQNNVGTKAQNLAESKESSIKPARSCLPKTSIESSPAKNGKIIPPNTAGYQLDSEHIEFLENLREKLLVLFEGLKMPELQDQQAKLDLVVNFLQYELCLLDEFLHKS